MKAAVRVGGGLLFASLLSFAGLVQGAPADSSVRFEPNCGQADPEVSFIARGHGSLALLMADGSALHLLPPSGRSRDRQDGRAAVLRMDILGSQVAPATSGEERLAAKSNYFLGSDPGKWRANIPSFARVRYKEVFPGVDLVYYGRRGGLEYDLAIAPGATPSLIRLGFQGARSVRLDGSGDLVVRTEDGELRQHRPRAYQERAGKRKTVAVRYRLEQENQVRFQVGAYDRTLPLVIDPVLTYSTYLGGSQFDAAYGIATDSSGAAYVVGETYSTNFSVRNAFQPSLRGGRDVFVAKLNPTGTDLVYSTFLGGTQNDSGRAIAVDAAGNAYVTGITCSLNFPVTAGSFRTAYSGLEDAFVAKLNAAGSLVYSTYLGAGGSDYAVGIAVDAFGNSYVTGYTSSIGFPTTSGAVQTAFRGGYYDAFVTKVNPSGSALVYSTYLGGAGNDTASGIAVDAAGNAYVTGQTDSANFPVLNPFQPSLAGANDAFVAKLNPAGSALVYSTYLGGRGPDQATAIAIDSAGSAYVTGSTASTNFPVVAGAFQASNADSYDVFVSKLSAGGNTLVYSTLLGGSGAEEGAGIRVDGTGRAYIAGFTDSMNFPVQQAAQGTFAGTRDAFAAVLNEAGTALNQSTYLGGAGEDRASGIALDAAGAAYVTGLTLSADFPVTAGAWRPAPIGSIDAFVTKLPAPNLPPAVVSVTPSSGSGMSQTFSFAASDPDGGGDIEAVMAVINATLGMVGGCVLYYDRATNTVAMVSDDGSKWLPGVMLSTAGTLQNSQCALDGSGSSAAVSGSTLTLNLKLTFKAGFTGLRKIYFIARDHSQASSGWQECGNWTVPAASNQPPTVVSLTPSSGSGMSQTFSFAASDPDGGGDIEAVMAVINATLDMVGGCVLYYDRATNTVAMVSDDASKWLPGVMLGTAGTLQNSQCGLEGSGSSAGVSGSTLTLNLKLTFRAGFAGLRKIYFIARDRSQASSGWQECGSWTVTGS